MKLYFIRHGQTDWNVEGRIQGSYDSDLNETGILQAEELGKRMVEEGYQISRIYSSPQKRAIKTAEIISGFMNVEYFPAKGLQELNLGDWEGMTWPEIQEKYPKEYELFHSNRRYEKPPKGESYQELLERVLKVIYKILDDNHKNIAIVTHGAVMMCLQCFLTGTPFSEMRKFHTSNATIREFDSKVFYEVKL